MSHAPICPQCNVQMVTRTRRSDGEKFYGCPNFPRCDETADHEDTDITGYGEVYMGDGENRFY